jgi:hypothetical protein
MEMQIKKVRFSAHGYLLNRGNLAISIAAAILSLLANSAIAGEMTETELLRLTTLDSAKRSAREAEIDAMTSEKQAEAMVAMVKDRTIIYYQEGHGVYVEYTSANNAIFMWYPRNRRVVKGTWGLRDFNGPKLCYSYRNAVHGITGQFEPTECISPGQKLIGAEVLDWRSGDPFGLSKEVIPYIKTRFDWPDWPKTQVELVPKP